MKHGKYTAYVRLGITAGAVALFALVCFFLLSHSGAIAAFFGSVLKILMPFLYGAVIAYILSPLCNKIEGILRRHKEGSGGWQGALSIFLSLLIALLIVILLLLLVIPNVTKSILQIINVLPAQIQSAVLWLHEVLETNPDLQASWDTFAADLSAKIISWLQTDLLTTVQSVIGSLSVQLLGIFNLLKNLFLGILISVYMLGSRRTFARQARLLLNGIFPKKWADLIEEEVLYADRMFNGFLMGRVIDSVIIGLICFIVTMLFGFDSAVLVSVIVGVTNIIPVFGPYLGAIPCALILLLENPLHCLIFLIFIVILQLIDGNVIGPRILGQTTGVSSFWVLFAVMLFGGLWGIVGMIIGVPVFAVIYDIIKKLTYAGLKRHGRKDMMPHPVQPREDQAAENEPEEDA